MKLETEIEKKARIDKITVSPPLKDSRLERYYLSQKKKEKLIQSQKLNSTPPSFFKHPEYVPIPAPGGVIVRPLSDNDPRYPSEVGDMRFYYSTFVQGLGSDNEGRKFPISYGFEPWFKHPLGKMISLIGKGSYNKSQKTAEYENSGHPLLDLILTNGDENPYSTGWQGSKVVISNVIDRGDNFCRDNKQAKVLAKTAQYYEKYNTWSSSFGVPVSIATEMLFLADKKQICPTDVDFLIYRYQWENPKIVDSVIKYYEIFLPEFDPQIFELYEDVRHMSNNYSTEALTEEEKSYKLYDFTKMDLYKPSTAGYVYSMLKNFIQEADKEFPGNHFGEELLDIAEEEKKARIFSDYNSVSSPVSVTIPTDFLTQPSQSEEEEAAEDLNLGEFQNILLI